MDRGLRALIASRQTRAPSISTGVAGNAYSDATHEIIINNRARLYALGDSVGHTWIEHERFYNMWLPFYATPYHYDPDGMSSPQREIWFREQAVKWSGDIADLENTSRSVPLNNWLLPVGVIVVGGVLIGLGARK